MMDFNFYNPTQIVFGANRLNELDNLVPKNARVMITYGGGSAKKYGTIGKVTEALGDRYTKEFAGIEPNPEYETLVKAVEEAKAEKIDFLLAVGGGDTCLRHRGDLHRDISLHLGSHETSPPSPGVWATGSIWRLDEWIPDQCARLLHADARQMA